MTVSNWISSMEPMLSTGSAANRENALPERRVAESLERLTSRDRHPLGKRDRGLTEALPPGKPPDDEPTNRTDRVEVAGEPHVEAGVAQAGCDVTRSVPAQVAISPVEGAIELSMRRCQDAYMTSWPEKVAHDPETPDVVLQVLQNVDEHG